MFRKPSRSLFRVLATSVLVVIAMPLGVLSASVKPIRALIVGGGTSHDHNLLTAQEDVKAIAALGKVSCTYIDKVDEIQPALRETDVLILCSDQPMSDPGLRQELLRFVNAGKGLILLHSILWYNWEDWPEFYRVLIGGGAKEHGDYGPFEVTVLDEKHPVMAGLPGSFKITDELYHFHPEPGVATVHALASGEEPKTGKIFPVVWVVKHAKARILCVSLGHDAKSHLNDSYKRILQNGVAWAGRRK